jgi:hypothetical protein
MQVLSSVHTQSDARHQVPHRAGGIAYIHLSALRLGLAMPALMMPGFSAIFI